MTYDYNIGDGAHAIDQQIQLDWHRGYQVVNASGGSNLVDDNNTADLIIRVTNGDINFGGTTVTCAEQTLDISADVDPDNPRKLTVYRDANGDAQYAAGTPEPAEPSGAVRRNAYRPAPPTLSGTNAVILATVWVPAGAASLSNADIRDRRMPASLDVDSVTSKSVNTDELSYTNAPPGALVGLSSNQTVPNNTQTKIAWDSATRDPNGLLNTTNNSIDIPSGFSYAKISTGYSFSNAVPVDFYAPKVNGGSVPGLEFYQDDGSISVRQRGLSTAWVGVSQNDSITVGVRQQSGGDATLQSADVTYLEVWLI